MITHAILDDALAAHNFWKMRLRNMIQAGKVDAPVEIIRRDDQCNFGQWLYGSTMSEADKQTPEYRSIFRLHSQFHEVAAAVAKAAEDGRLDDARQMMSVTGEYYLASSRLEAALLDWKRRVDSPRPEPRNSRV